jgi:hypothetical protein
MYTPGHKLLFFFFFYTSDSGGRERGEEDTPTMERIIIAD